MWPFLCDSYYWTGIGIDKPGILIIDSSWWVKYTLLGHVRRRYYSRFRAGQAPGNNTPYLFRSINVIRVRRVLEVSTRLDRYITLLKLCCSEP